MLPRKWVIPNITDYQEKKEDVTEISTTEVMSARSIRTFILNSSPLLSITRKLFAVRSNKAEVKLKYIEQNSVQKLAIAAIP